MAEETNNFFVQSDKQDTVSDNYFLQGAEGTVGSQQDAVPDQEADVQSEAFLSTAASDIERRDNEQFLTAEEIKTVGLENHRKKVAGQFLSQEVQALSEETKRLLTDRSVPPDVLPDVLNSSAVVVQELSNRSRKVETDDSLEAKRTAMEQYLTNLQDAELLLSEPGSTISDFKDLREVETAAAEAAVMQDIQSLISDSDWTSLLGDGADLLAKNLLPGPPSVAVEVFEKELNKRIGDGKNRSFTELSNLYLSADPSEKIELYKKAKEAAAIAYGRFTFDDGSPGTKANKVYETMALLGFVGIDQDFLKFEIGSDVLSGALFLAKPLLGLTNAFFIPRKIRNLSRSLLLAKKMRTEKLVNEMIFKASVGDEAALEKASKILGLTPEEIANSFHPVQTDAVIGNMALRDSSTDLLRAGLRAELGLQEDADKLIAQIRAGEFSPSLFTEQSRAQMLKNVEDLLEESGAIMREAGEKVYNLRLVDETPDTMTFAYTSEKDGVLAEKTHTLDYTYDLEVGTWKLSDSKFDKLLPSVSSFLKSPSELFKNEGIVDRATVADNQLTRLEHKLQVLEQSSFLVGDKLKRLGLLSRRNVDAVVQQGSLENKVYSAKELIDGVPTERGVVSLSNEEIEAYFKRRRFFDALGDIEDMRLYNEATRRGYKQVSIGGFPEAASVLEGRTYKTKGGALQAIARALSSEKKPVKVSDLTAEDKALVKRGADGRFFISADSTVKKKELGKVYENLDDALASVKGSKFRNLKTGENVSASVWDPLLNKGSGGLTTKGLTKANIERRYAEGWRLTKVKLGGGQIDSKRTANFIWVRKGDVQDLPFNMLKRPAGYVPRIYKDNVVFVKEIDMEGNPVRTVHTFSNYEAAVRYASARNGTKGIKYKVFRNDELREEDVLSTMIDRSGNLFTGTRKSRLVPHDDGNNVHPILPANKAVQRAIDHAAKVVTKAELVQVMKRRWLNKLNLVAKAEKAPNGGLANPEDFYSELTLNKNSVAAQQLERARKYIKQVQNLPTSGIFNWARIVRPLQNALDKTVLDGLKVAGINVPLSKTVAKGGSVLLNHLSASNPAAFVKGIVFHSLLGIWNPVQLLVQASGMSVAMALNPVRAPKTFQEIIALRALRYLPEDAVGTVRSDIFRAVSKATGVDEKTLRLLNKEFKESGLLDSIATNADLEMLESGVAVSTSLVGRVLRDPLYFYKEGETFTRMYGWLEARAALKAKGVPLTKEAVLKETYRRLINFQRTNKALYQEGVTGVFTQFMQVPFKYTGRFFSKEWTPLEKLQVGLFQTGMFGAAGVPLLGDELVQGMARWILGVDDPRDLTEENKRQIKGGLLTGLQQALGLDAVDLSSRLSMGGDLRFTGAVDIITADTPYFEIPPLFGLVNKIKTAWETFFPVYSKFSKSDYDFSTLTKKDLEYAMRALASVTSTTNNAMKAYLMNNTKKLFSTDGHVILDRRPQGFSAWELLGAAMGFQLADAKDVFEAIKYNTDRKAVLKNAVDTLVKMHDLYINDIDVLQDKDEELVRLSNHYDKSKAYIKEVFDLDGLEVDRVWKAYLDRILEGKTSEDRNMRQIRKSIEERLLTDEDATASNISPLLPVGNITEGR